MEGELVHVDYRNEFECMSGFTSTKVQILTQSLPAEERGERYEVEYRDEFVCISGFTSTKVQIHKRAARQEMRPSATCV